MEATGLEPRMIDLSVVIPVYGCDSCLRTLRDRLEEAIRPITDSFELVFVDDRSPDASWDVLRQLARESPSVRLLRLSRNFGQHAAITAGLEAATGRWTVVMDCDLQDPPEAIPRLYAKAREGFDIVLARRTRRRQQWFRRLAGSVYYRFRNMLVKSDMYVNYTQFSILSRKVVDAFLKLRDKDRQYLLIVQWLGFERADIEVEPQERHAGRSSYRFGALLRVAVDGMFFQSTVLLRWIVYAGFMLAAGGIALAAYATVVFALGRPHPDWLALSMAALLLSGFIVVSTGVTGLYVGKVFDQVKGRPLFVVDTEVVDGVERPVSDEVPPSAEPDRVTSPVRVDAGREGLSESSPH
jgi:polyisoprenyl-phosphate glycosyltransferase